MRPFRDRARRGLIRTRPQGGGGDAASRVATPGDADWRSYDTIAQTYAQVLAPRMALPAGDLVHLAGVRPGSRVLDVGTGTGVCARAAASALNGDGIVVGVDVSLGMLRQADREGGGPFYAAAAAIDLPFSDGTFDYLLSCFSLSHFPRYETALFDMLRVLASRGRFGVSAWGPGQDMFSQAWRQVAEQFVERRMLDDALRRALPWDEFFSDAGRLKNVLYEAGLREIQVSTREYRFEMTAADYLAGREITASGRFLRQMLGERLWETFRRRTRAVFTERFPERFNDFRDVLLAVGNKA